MNVSKAKLSKGLTYPLKSSFLARQLEEAGINTYVDMVYSPDHSFFEVFYWLPNENVDYCRFYVRTGAVSLSDRREATADMQNRVVPEFVEWAKELLALPENSTKLQGELHFWRSR